MPSDNLRVSIIMPALNEEGNIGQALNNTLRAMQDYNIDGEIIVIDDGSRDKTAGIVRELMKQEPRLKLLTHKTPLGIGASFWDGVDNASKDIVIMMPGDNENDPWEILRYYQLLEHVDIVIPFIFNRQVRPFFRNALSFIYRFIINTTFSVNFNYTNGTVIYRKSILKQLKYRSSGFFFQTDILIRRAKEGYLFAEVPYRISRREGGASKAISFPSLLKVIRGYLRLVKDCYGKRNPRQAVLFPKDSLTAIRRDNES